jgi:hypothetical protein
MNIKDKARTSRTPETGAKTYALARDGSGVPGASWRRTHRNRRFIRNGEFRTPKGGEFYLSGAIPEVYVAFSDYSSPYYIMREVMP